MATHRPSFGVESEFMVCVQQRGTTNGVPQMFASSTGGPMIVDSLDDTIEVSQIVETRLTETINNVTRDYTGSRITDDYDMDSDDEAQHLRNYNDWFVDDDDSIHLPPDISAQEHVASYLWVPVEITSPALWATEDSFEEVRRVFRTIQSQFWICTPDSAGFHIHYGTGKDYIPFLSLRRIAAFVVAADPILTQLHPVHRRDNIFCMSNRLYSRLSHGSTARETSQRIQREEVEADAEFPDANITPPNANPRPRRRRELGFRSVFKRGTLQGYIFNEERYRYTTNAQLGDTSHPKSDPVRPLDIPPAVQEILSCVNAPTIAELMRYEQGAFDRPAYSFLRYGRKWYQRSPRRNMRTLEFRQMGATVDPEVIVAHVKTIVRLCQWASTVDLDHLWKVALDCAAGEWEPAYYDVFDLLIELGLVDEARVLQRDVARELGDGLRPSYPGSP
ncbi:putative amidoligase enzyme-domain-containing protein [Biscogniauxia marginata]|nr:putative amidoligase enzyme-domain-containing protein [Biscogniauxia marginata]